MLFRRLMQVLTGSAFAFCGALVALAVAQSPSETQLLDLAAKAEENRERIRTLAVTYILQDSFDPPLPEGRCILGALGTVKRSLLYIRHPRYVEWHEQKLIEAGSPTESDRRTYWRDGVGLDVVDRSCRIEASRSPRTPYFDYGAALGLTAEALWEELPFRNAVERGHVKASGEIQWMNGRAAVVVEYANGKGLIDVQSGMIVRMEIYADPISRVRQDLWELGDLKIIEGVWLPMTISLERHFIANERSGIPNTTHRVALRVLIDQMRVNAPIEAKKFIDVMPLGGTVTDFVDMKSYGICVSSNGTRIRCEEKSLPPELILKLTVDRELSR